VVVRRAAVRVGRAHQTQDREADEGPGLPFVVSSDDTPSDRCSTLNGVAKVVVQFTCSECGTTSGRWLGRCPGCGAFGTLVEELHGADGGRTVGAARSPQRLGDVRATEAARLETGVPELDRVLGGGLVPASLVLVGGEPGVGKSTLLLSALGSISRSGRAALLVTGEESVAQVRLRADRLGGADDVAILAETELESVCATLEHERPTVCVIDSVQTLHAAELGSVPGSVAQVREAASRLLRVAKQSGVATVLVGHVTKDGAVAGPRVLEHLVDCVLQFEGDRYHAHRVLRAVKNRFGSTNELGVFEMTAEGLVGVPEPSAVFGATRGGEAGAAVAVTFEGTRPLLLEIQALVSRTDLAMPRRVGNGVDPKRLAMIVAVLSRHGGVPLGSADVFVNVAGGVRVDEPGADLAIALAIASAARGAPVVEGVAAFGELGLTGRLRPAAQAERRLDECARLGVAVAVAPEGTRGRPPAPRVVGAGTVREALRAGLVTSSAGGEDDVRDAALPV
jgi:DNA repair protein RadA/Sms